MAFRLKRKETVTDGVRRIAHQQLARAAGELADESLDPAEQVHQVRKRMKKLRALLRLVREEIGKSAYRRENGRLRAVGRRLSDARDAQVMLDIADALAGDHPDLATAGFDTLRAYLAHRRDRQSLENRATTLADEVSGELVDADARIDRWPLGATGFEGIAPGLRRAYKRGRRAMRRLDDDSTDAQLHAWRKRVKDHWYHSRLLEKVWPGLMSCYVDELKKLSDLLGDYHDLAVFQATLAQRPDGVLSEKESDAWQRRAAYEKRALRRHAERLGARVYAERPKRFMKRLGCYWRTWRRR